MRPEQKPTLSERFVDLIFWPAFLVLDVIEFFIDKWVSFQTERIYLQGGMTETDRRLQEHSERIRREFPEEMARAERSILNDLGATRYLRRAETMEERSRLLQELPISPTELAKYWKEKKKKLG